MSSPGSGTPGSSTPGAVGGSTNATPDTEKPTASPVTRDAYGNPVQPGQRYVVSIKTVQGPKGSGAVDYLTYSTGETSSGGSASQITSDQAKAEAEQANIKELGFTPGAQFPSTAEVNQKVANLGIKYESQTGNLVNGVIQTGGPSARDLYVNTLLTEVASGYKGQGFKTEEDYLSNRLNQVGLDYNPQTKTITDPLLKGIIQQEKENETKGGYAGISLGGGPATSLSEKLGSSFGQKGLGYVPAVNKDGTLNYSASQIASLISSVKNNPEYGGNQNFLVGNIGTENSTGSLAALNLNQSHNTDIPNSLANKNKSISLTETLGISEGISGGSNLEKQGSNALGIGLNSLSRQQIAEHNLGVALSQVSNQQIEQRNLSIEEANQVITQQNIIAKGNFAVDYLLPNKPQSRYTGLAAILPPAGTDIVRAGLGFLKNTGLSIEATGFSIAERIAKANIFSSNPLGLTPFTILTPKNQETLNKYAAPQINEIKGVEGLVTGQGTTGFESGQGQTYDITQGVLTVGSLLIGSGITKTPSLVAALIAKSAVGKAIGSEAKSAAIIYSGKGSGVFDVKGTAQAELETTLTRNVGTYKNLNMMRTPLAKDIFESDLALGARPIGSASVTIPTNTTLENTASQIEQLKQSTSDLLKPSSIESTTSKPVPVQEDVLFRNIVPMKSLGSNNGIGTGVKKVDANAVLGTGTTPPEDLTGSTAPIKKTLPSTAQVSTSSSSGLVPGSGVPGSVGIAGAVGGQSSAGVPDIFQQSLASRVDFERRTSEKANPDLFESGFVPYSSGIISPSLRSTEIGQRLEALDLFKKGIAAKKNASYYTREGVPKELMGKFSKLISSQTVGSRPEIFGTKPVKLKLEDIEYNPAENFQPMPRTGKSPFDIQFGDITLFSKQEFTSNLLSPEEQALAERYPLMKNTLPNNLNPFNEPRTTPRTGTAPIQKDTFNISETVKGREEAKFFGTFELKTGFEEIGYIPKAKELIKQTVVQEDVLSINKVPMKSLGSNNKIGTQIRQVDIENLLGESFTPKEETTEIGLKNTYEWIKSNLVREKNTALHGTDLLSALNIISSGIKFKPNLLNRIIYKIDNGFFVSENPSLAEYFAQASYARNTKPVFLKFNLNESKIAKFEEVGPSVAIARRKVEPFIKEGYAGVERFDFGYGSEFANKKEIVTFSNEAFIGKPTLIDATDIINLKYINPKAQGLSPLEKTYPTKPEDVGSLLYGESIEKRESVPIYVKESKIIKESNLDAFYSPQENIRQFFERLESNKPNVHNNSNLKGYGIERLELNITKNKTKINTDKLLGIDTEEPAIGESKERLDFIEQGAIKRTQRESKLIKIPQKNPEDVLIKASQHFESEQRIRSELAIPEETILSLGEGEGALRLGKESMVFHGSNRVESNLLNKENKIISSSISYDIASGFGRKTFEFILNPKAKVVKLEYLPKELTSIHEKSPEEYDKALLEYSKKYGIDIVHGDPFYGELETAIINKNMISKVAEISSKKENFLDFAQRKIHEEKTAPNSNPIEPNLNISGGSEFKSTIIRLGVGEGRLIPRGGGLSSILKNFGKPSNPPPRPEEPKGKETRSGSGLIQILKEQTKQENPFKEYPIQLGEGLVTIPKKAKKITANLTGLESVTTQVLIQEQEQKLKQSSSLIFQPLQTFKQAQGLLYKPLQKQKQPQDFKQIFEQEQTPDQAQLFKQLQGQQPALKQPQLLKQIEENPFPNITPEKQLQLLENIPQIPQTPHQKNPNPPVGDLFEEHKKYPKKKKEKGKLFNYIGNVPEFDIVGVFKRNETIYGNATIARLTAQDTANMNKKYSEKYQTGKEKTLFTSKGNKIKVKGSTAKPKSLQDKFKKKIKI